MPDLKRIVLRSGPCLDSVPLLGLYLKALRSSVFRWPAILSRLKFSPDILANIRASALPPEGKSRLFSEAMTLFRSGPAYKTTAAGRSRLTDGEILKLLRPGLTVLETGVSDGVSALGLLRGAGGARVLLSDRQAGYTRSGGLVKKFYDAEEGLLSLKLPGFYFCTGVKAPAPPAGADSISLLNPLLESAFPGLKLAEFDLLRGAAPETADVIKCANVLNKVYFTTEEIGLALANLLASLRDGGWLFISQSNPRYEDGEAYIALRRDGAGFVLAGEAHGHELLPDLRAGLFSGLLRPGAAA